MADPKAIGEAFVKTYYDTFDSNRAGVAALYAADAQLSFEGALSSGRDAIVAKLVGLSFKVVKHIITTCDTQVALNQGLIVKVVGQLKTDDDPPHGFSQVFLLAQVEGSLFIANDIFRLHLHHG